MGQPCVKAFLRCIKSLSPVPAGYQKGGCNFTSRRNQCKAMDGAGYFTGYGAFRSHLSLKLLYPNLQRVLDLGELIVEKGCDEGDRKSTRLNSSHLGISHAVFCLK